MQTAIAWMLAKKLEAVLSGQLSLDYMQILTDFSFQALGQHQDAKWFRKDIFHLTDWLDARLKWNIRERQS